MTRVPLLSPTLLNPISRSCLLQALLAPVLKESAQKGLHSNGHLLNYTDLGQAASCWESLVASSYRDWHT